MADAAHHDHDPLAPDHLIAHVKDAGYFELPRALGEKLHLPQFTSGDPILTIKTGISEIDSRLEPVTLKFTKFMALEVIAAIGIVVVFCWLAGKLRGGDRPKGRLVNLLETMLVYIRDQVARPAIGHHDADRFLPFLWTLFFFVLACNLLGMLPWSGSPTAAMGMTGALAFITFATVVGSGMAAMGPVGFWVGQVPHMDLPLPIAIILKPGIFLIEVLGLVIKHFVLAVRLLANIFAGHLVLSVIVAFVMATAKAGFTLWAGVTVASILGATALSLLELAVAFLQAYIFTFLAALFIGSAVHSH